jgi:hypothetical protein
VETVEVVAEARVACEATEALRRGRAWTARCVGTASGLCVRGEGTLGRDETGAGLGEGRARREDAGELRRPIGEAGGRRDGESGIWLVQSQFGESKSRQKQADKSTAKGGSRDWYFVDRLRRVLRVRRDRDSARSRDKNERYWSLSRLCWRVK